MAQATLISSCAVSFETLPKAVMYAASTISVAVAPTLLAYVKAFVKLSSLISRCAIIHDCSKHIRYVKGKVKDSNLKKLDHLIENQADGNNDSDVKTLRDLYYYTSSNELRELLNILREYKGYFKKSRKIS